jgi:hypothetical protein
VHVTAEPGLPGDFRVSSEALYPTDSHASVVRSLQYRVRMIVKGKERTVVAQVMDVK